MLVSWWYLYLGAQSLYRQGKNRVCVCLVQVNDRDERVFVHITGRPDCPVTDLDLNR